MQYKKCSTCLVIKSFQEFHKDLTLKYGKCSQCKACSRISHRANGRKNIASWIGFIPKEASCECCGKKLYFQAKSKNEKIFFDHRYGESSLIKIPLPWLWKHKFNEKNKVIWESCDFGILCNVCNFRMPTLNREKFLINFIRYFYGPSKNIHASEGSRSIE